MTCGECGFTAQFEKQLGKRHRQLGIAVLAILSCVAVATIINERLMVRGWMGLVPTKALILSLPLTMDLQSKSYLELLKRMQASELSDGEWKMLMKRCAKGDFQREVAERALGPKILSLPVVTKDSLPNRPVGCGVAFGRPAGAVEAVEEPEVSVRSDIFLGEKERRGEEHHRQKGDHESSRPDRVPGARSPITLLTCGETDSGSLFPA